MLKRIYPNQTDIPAGLEEHYKEVDGSWVLQVEGSKSEEDVARLTKALNAERSAHAETKKKAKTLEDLETKAGGTLDIDRYLAVMDAVGDEGEISKLIEKLKNGGATQEHINRAVARERAKLEEEKKAIEAERDRFKSAHLGAILDQELTAALLKHKVDRPGLVEGAKALLRPRIKVNENTDGSLTLEMGDLHDTVDSYVENWVTGEGKPFRSGSGNQGGGGAGSDEPGAGEINPWDPKTLNITKQSEIYRTNPAKAKAMAAKFGKTI